MSNPSADSLQAFEALLRMRGSPSGGGSGDQPAPDDLQRQLSSLLNNPSFPLTNAPPSSASLAELSSILSGQSAIGRGGSLQSIYSQLLPALNPYLSANQPILSQLVSPGTEQQPAASIGPGNESAGLKQSLLLPQKAPASSSDVKVQKSALSGQLVRKDKVQQALKSKPQRGRKRDDLSASERLELTRTRNREHAKCTRMRKKARHQELVEYAEESRKTDELNSQRRQAVNSFLSIREGMLQTSAEMASAKSTWSVSTEGDVKRESDACYKEGTKREARSVSFSNSKETSPKNPIMYPELLKELVVDSDLSTFKYLVNGLDIGVEGMDKFDRDLASGFADSSCKGEPSKTPPKPSLLYHIIGGSEGIALSQDNTAIARVELNLNKKEKKTIMVGFMTARFAAKSSQLQAVEWNTVYDAVRSVSQGGENGSTSSYPLVRQSVYPSSVSLDHEKVEGYGSPGPGMDL